MVGEAELCRGRCSLGRRCPLLLTKPWLFAGSPGKLCAVGWWAAIVGSPGCSAPEPCPQPATNQDPGGASEAGGHRGLHRPGSAAGANFSPGTPFLLMGSMQPRESLREAGDSPIPRLSHCSLQSCSSSSFFIPAARPALLRCPCPSAPSLPAQLCSALCRAAAPVPAPPGAGLYPRCPPCIPPLPAPSRSLRPHFAHSP